MHSPGLLENYGIIFENKNIIYLLKHTSGLPLCNEFGIPVYF